MPPKKKPKVIDSSSSEDSESISTSTVSKTTNRKKIKGNKGTKSKAKTKSSTESSSDSSRELKASVELIIHPAKAVKSVIQKMVGDDVELDMTSKIFKFEAPDIFVIVDKDKKAWYKGTDICNILEYAAGRNAIGAHVSNPYKKAYVELMHRNNTLMKIDPKTLFISSPGVFQLVSRSKKPEAIKLWEFISETILPELFSTGTYSLPATQRDIEHLTKSFYDDNIISTYNNILAIYLAYIGVYKGKHILKFGKTNDFVTRDLKQHRKMYKQFNVIKIWETLANDLVETNIKDNFLSKNMLTSLTKEDLGIKCKEKTKRELVILNEVNGLDYCLDMIESVVKTTVLPQEEKYRNEIESLKLQNKIDALEQEVKHLTEMNKQLKDNMNDLRKKRK